jgi:hypothetical protein
MKRMPKEKLLPKKDAQILIYGVMIGIIGSVFVTSVLKAEELLFPAYYGNWINWAILAIASGIGLLFIGIAVKKKCLSY